MSCNMSDVVRRKLSCGKAGYMGMCKVNGGKKRLNVGALLMVVMMLMMGLMLGGCSGSGGSDGGSSDAQSGSSVDVDLTALSSTMIYSEVNNMMTAPDDYIGKTVKMQGNFSVYEDEKTGNYYTAVLISDATSCCSQGMEFKLKGDKKYPDDYPEVEEEITVVGTFGTYEEDGIKYCCLEDAEIV